MRNGAVAARDQQALIADVRALHGAATANQVAILQAEGRVREIRARMGELVSAHPELKSVTAR